jgi:hypothetical protein
MTRKQQRLLTVFVKAIDLLKKNTSTENRSANPVRVLTVDDVSLQEWQTNNEL